MAVETEEHFRPERNRRAAETLDHFLGLEMEVKKLLQEHGDGVLQIHQGRGGEAADDGAKTGGAPAARGAEKSLGPREAMAAQEEVNPEKRGALEEEGHEDHLRKFALLARPMQLARDGGRFDQISQKKAEKRVKITVMNSRAPPQRSRVFAKPLGRMLGAWGAGAKGKVAGRREGAEKREQALALQN